jgi:Mrp family chromosome partitioning ATPase
MFVTVELDRVLVRQNENLMLTHQVARALGVGKRRLNRYISSGKIPAPANQASNGYHYWTLKRSRKSHTYPARARVAERRAISLTKLVVSNQKGGVAKTTSTHTLARYMADRGNRVLVIDTDSQGSLAVALGVKFQHNLHDMVINGLSLEDTVAKVYRQPETQGDV